MGLGIFRKIGKFVKKAAKWVKKKALPIAKKVWTFAKPIVQTVLPMIPGVGAASGAITKGIDTGLNIADKVVNATSVGDAVNQVKHTVSPFIKLKKGGDPGLPVGAVASGPDLNDYPI